MTDPREHLAQQLQQILSAQQESAERGLLPPPRDFLEQFPDIRADKHFAVDVLYNDFLLRHEIASGGTEQPRAEEYLRAFPDLAEEFSRQMELHHSLDELQPEELGRASDNQLDGGARFTNRKKVAEGGFADVYRAWDSQLKRSVAIKISRTAILDEESQLYLRFQREAESAAQLSHPSVVQVYEFGIEDSKPFIVSQFMEGGSLAERLQQGSVGQNQAAEWIVHICEAADYANRFGIVHRDIKPGNILFDDSNEPHLGDFGLASLSDEKSRLTEHGDVLGTPAYMSPEQAMAKSDVGPASDVYSLGVVLYELLTGQLPFQGKAHSVIQQAIHSQPEDPRKLRSGLPSDLSVICLKALAKEPKVRYQSPRALAEDLRRFLDHQPIHARPVGFVGKTIRFARRQPALAITLLVACLVVGATAWLGISGIAEQRDLFRGERDRANQELYQSLLSQAESRLREKQSDWYGESLQLLERAAEVRPDQQDVSRHRDLVIETLASDAPRFELLSERKLDRPPHLIAVSPDSPDIAFVSKPKYPGEWPSITYMPSGLRGSKVEFPVLGRKTCTQLEFAGAEMWALCDGSILAWHTDDIKSGDSVAVRDRSPTENIMRFCANRSFVAVATKDGISLFSRSLRELVADRVLDTDGAQVLDMQFRSEQEICAALDNGWLISWDTETGLETSRHRHLQPIKAFTGTGRFRYFIDGVSNRVHAVTNQGVTRLSAILHTRIDWLSHSEGQLFAGLRRGELLKITTDEIPLQIEASVQGPSAMSAMTSVQGKHIYCGYQDGTLAHWALRDSDLVESYSDITQPLSVDKKGNFWSAWSRINPAKESQPESFKLPRIRGQLVKGTTKYFLRGDQVVVLDKPGKWHDLEFDAQIDFIVRTPEQGLLAAVDQDSVLLLDSRDGKILRRAPLPRTRNVRSAVSDQERLVVASSSEAFACDWQTLLSEGPFKWQAICRTDQPRPAIALRDGRVAVSVANSKIEIQDLGTGNSILQIESNEDAIVALDFVPSTNNILGLLSTNEIREWSSEGKVLRQFSVAEAATDFALDPNEQFLVVHGNAQAALYDFKKGELLGLLTDGYGAQHCAFESSGDILWLDGQRYLREDLESCRQTRQNVRRYKLGIPRHPIFFRFACAVTHGVGDQQWHVRAGHSGYIYLCDQGGRRVERILGEPDFGDVWCLEFSPDDRLLAVGTESERGGEVVLYDTSNWEIFTRFDFSEKLIADIAFHPSSEFLAISSYDGSVSLLDEHGELLETLLSPGQAVMDLEFSPDGRYLLGVRSSEGVFLWAVDPTLKSAKLEQQIADAGEYLWGLSWGPKQKQFATVSESGMIRLYRFPSCEVLVSLQSSLNTLRKVAFSPSGDYLAVSRFYQPGQIWDIKALRKKLADLGLDW